MSVDKIKISEVGKPFTEREVRECHQAMAEKEDLREVTYDEALRALRWMKLKRLAEDRYNITVTNFISAMELALKLATEHEPSFKVTKGRGRPKKALSKEDFERIAGLAIDIKNGKSMTSAAKRHTEKPKAPRHLRPGAPAPAAATEKAIIKPVSSEAVKKDYMRLRNTGGIAAALPAPRPSLRGCKGKNRKR
jgi:hypothetical protein